MHSEKFTRIIPQQRDHCKEEKILKKILASTVDAHSYFTIFLKAGNNIQHPCLICRLQQQNLRLLDNFLITIYL